MTALSPPKKVTNVWSGFGCKGEWLFYANSGGDYWVRSCRRRDWQSQWPCHLYSWSFACETVLVEITEKKKKYQRGILGKCFEKEYTSNVFLNIGIGLLKFSKENKILYKTLFVDSDKYSYLIEEFFARSLEQMKKESTLSVLNEEELKRILEKTRLFTHGLATFICSGNMDDKPEEYLYEILKEVGEDITGYTIFKKNQMAALKN